MLICIAKAQAHSAVILTQGLPDYDDDHLRVSDAEARVRARVSSNPSSSAVPASGKAAASSKAAEKYALLKQAQEDRAREANLQALLRTSKKRCTCRCPIHTEKCNLRDKHGVVRHRGFDVMGLEDYNWYMNRQKVRRLFHISFISVSCQL